MARGHRFVHSLSRNWVAEEAQSCIKEQFSVAVLVGSNDNDDLFPSFKFLIYLLSSPDFSHNSGFLLPSLESVLDQTGSSVSRICLTVSRYRRCSSSASRPSVEFSVICAEVRRLNPMIGDILWGEFQYVWSCGIRDKYIKKKKKRKRVIWLGIVISVTQLNSLHSRLTKANANAHY